jgi:hypothetical protein
MSRCIRSCGRKARPGSKLCAKCEKRQAARDRESGRYKPRRIRAKDIERSIRYWR